jgi:peptidoglycan hydrolase CwlO-like protein
VGALEKSELDLQQKLEKIRLQIEVLLPVYCQLDRKMKALESDLKRYQESLEALRDGQQSLFGEF